MTLPTALGIGPRARRGWTAGALLLAVVLQSTGCAYYNTFYLARKYYNQALDEEKKNTTGRISPAASAGYDKAIKQCSKVLQRYRTSKWADDALLLMGKSFFGQGQYGESRRWMQELVNLQASSPHVPEARVWIGRTHLQEEDYELAARVLRETLEAYPVFEARGEALFFIAETELRQEHWAEAVTGYREMIERYPKSERVSEALLKVGDAQFGLKQYADAERSYQLSANRAREPRQRMQSLLKVGAAIEKQNRYADATRLYDELSAELVPRDRLNTILSGFDAALPVQNTGPIGGVGGVSEQEYIQQNTFIDENGIPVLRNPLAGSNGTNNPGGTNPNNPNTINEPIAPRDPRSTGEGNATARAAASLATSTNPLAADLPQVLLRYGNAHMEMGEYERAVKTFESVMASYPRTSEAAEAQYRVGYIQEVYLADFASARSSYDLVKLHGQSLFSEQAVRRSGGLARLVALAAADTGRVAAGDALVEQEAEKKFLEAELAWFQQEQADKAIALYAAVEQNYPATSFAARSALARAWLLANAVDDTVASRAAFEEVETRYAGTDQARMAHQILYGEVVPAAAAPDPLAIAAFEDSLLRAEALADSQAAQAVLDQAAETASEAGRAPDPTGSLDSTNVALGESSGATSANPLVDGSFAPPNDGSPVPIPAPINSWARVEPAPATADSLNRDLAREAARRRSEAEARAMAESTARGGDSIATATPLDPAVSASPGTATASPDGAAPAPVAALGTTAVTGVPGMETPTSRLAPENATGLPRVFTMKRPVRAPANRPPRVRTPKPVPTPAPADSTRGGNGGRRPEQAWH